jgi:hypothetical protein
MLFLYALFRLIENAKYSIRKKGSPAILYAGWPAQPETGNSPDQHRKIPCFLATAYPALLRSQRPGYEHQEKGA